MSQERERTRYPQTDTPIPSQQRTETLIPSLFSFTALAFFFFGVVLLILLVVGIVKNWSLLTASTSVLVQVLIVLAIVALPLTLISIGIQKGYLSWLAMKQANIATLKAQEELAAMRDHRQRANEQHALELYLLESRLPADGLGNRAGIYNRKQENLSSHPRETMLHQYHTPSTCTMRLRLPAPASAKRHSQSYRQASSTYTYQPLGSFSPLVKSIQACPIFCCVLNCSVMNTPGWFAGMNPTGTASRTIPPCFWQEHQRVARQRSWRMSPRNKPCSMPPFISSTRIFPTRRNPLRENLPALSCVRFAACDEGR